MIEYFWRKNGKAYVHYNNHFYYNLQVDPHEQDSLNLNAEKLRELFNQIFFLIDEGKRVDQFNRGRKIDKDTLETLKALGYIK